MSSLSLTDFLGRLVESGLLRPRVLELIQKGIQDETIQSIDELGTRLISDGHFTQWQFDQLLGGRTSFLLDKYILQSRLDAGGMGTIFKALQPPFNRLVAIKVVHDRHKDDEQHQRRIRIEMDALSKLEHKNIVRIYDGGYHLGEAFIVMELIEGQGLDELVVEQPLSLHLACEFCRQVANGLQYAMEKGIVHRDIKPANLLVVHDDRESPVIKILDFGLAILEGASRHTGEKRGMGTVGFVAPEQARDARSADIRADIYSLGCTLCFLLTKRHPRSIDLHTELAQHYPQLAKPLASIISTMVAEDPKDRYQTPAEVAAALLPLASRGAEKHGSDDSSNSSPVPHTHYSGMLLRLPPFHYGYVVPPEYFIDRQEELAQAQELLEAGQGFLLVGRRRSGKTSFCKKVIHELQQKPNGRLLATHLNLEMHSELTLETFLEHTILNVCGEVARAFGGKYYDLRASNLGDVDPILRKDVHFGSLLRLFRLISERTHARGGDRPPPLHAEEFVDFTKEVVDIARRRRYTNVVVFYDEANRLPRDISEHLLSHIEEALHETGVIGVYAASPEMAESFKLLKGRFGDELQLGPFQSMADMRRLLARYYYDDESCQDELPITAAALERLWALSQGDPFSIQMIAGRSFRRARKDAAANLVDVRHVDAANDELAVEEPEFFKRS